MPIQDQNRPDNHIDYFAPKVLWTILSVLLLIVVVGMVCYAKVVKQTQQSLEQSEKADPTADWKTYRNEEYGFEFQIPSDWQVKSDQYSKLTFQSKKSEIATLENYKNCDRTGTGSCIPEWMPWDIIFYDETGLTPDIEQYYEVQEKNLGNVKWKFYFGLDLFASSVYETTSNNKVFRFDIFTDEKTGEKILSTFKFIE